MRKIWATIYRRDNILFSLALMSVFMMLHFTQSSDATELALILSCNPIGDVSGADSAHTSFSYSNPKKLLLGAIKFYQLFISTQDTPACNFIPSCSQFGAEAIRQFGVIRGILLTSDRLQRCNGMSVSRYQIDYKSGKFLDPVQLYSDIFREKGEADE